MASEREALLFSAKVAEQAERYVSSCEKGNEKERERESSALFCGAFSDARALRQADPGLS
jgi:hypothetical protein